MEFHPGELYAYDVSPTKVVICRFLNGHKLKDVEKYKKKFEEAEDGTTVNFEDEDLGEEFFVFADYKTGENIARKYPEFSQSKVRPLTDKEYFKYGC